MELDLTLLLLSEALFQHSFQINILHSFQVVPECDHSALLLRNKGCCLCMSERQNNPSTAFSTCCFLSHLAASLKYRRAEPHDLVEALRA